MTPERRAELRCILSVMPNDARPPIRVPELRRLLDALDAAERENATLRARVAELEAERTRLHGLLRRAYRWMTVEDVAMSESEEYERDCAAIDALPLGQEKGEG